MLHYLIPLLLTFPAIKEEIASYQQELSQEEKGETHYKLALAYFRDQETDKAFQHFLCALKSVPEQATLEMSSKEKTVYEEALSAYLKGAGSDPVRISRQMLETYGEAADTHRDWLHLNFLVAAAYANLGQYDLFFERFYEGYPYLCKSFLAYKIQGILCLRLAQHGRSTEERQTYRKEACRYMTEAMDRNPQDASVYKVLIFLAKDEKNEALVLNFLEKMVENKAHIARGDIYLYVQEAVALKKLALGQQIIDLARTHYDYSRAIADAQEYLNQCRG